MSYLLRIEKLSAGYSSDRSVLKDLSLEIPKQRIIALLGRNGTGKTTLLKALLGMTNFRDGSISYLSPDNEVSGWSYKKLSREIAYVPQENLFPEHLSVLDYLKFSAIPLLGMWEGYGKSITRIRSEIPEALVAKKLWYEKLRDISSGERQKVFLCRAILQNTPLLLLDEPTNHLDPSAKHYFWQWLSEGSRKDAAFLLSTHDLAYVKRFATWVVAFGPAGLLFSGEVNQYFADSKNIEATFGSEIIFS